MWYQNLKIANNEQYRQSDAYGYWIFPNGELLPVSSNLGHIGALKHLNIETNTQAFAANLVRLVTENRELWVQFDWVKPTHEQKKTLIDMARNWNFVKYIVDSTYLNDDRIEYDSDIDFVRAIRQIQ